MMRNTRKLAAIALATLVTAPAALAQEVMRLELVDPPQQMPALGGGLRAGSYNYVGETARTDLVPLYLYDGERIFAHGTSIGVHLIDADAFTFDVLGRVRYDQLDPKSNTELSHLNKRKFSADAGVSATLKGRLGQLSLTAVADTLGRSNGSEVDLTYRKQFSWGPWGVTPYIGVFWQDEKLTGYYYGVSAAEATPEYPEYTPGEAVNVEWGINSSYQITDHFFAFANVGFDSLDSTIFNSPIVRAKHNAYGFLGAGYIFGDHKRKPVPAEYQAAYESAPKWTWRLHYGYQIHHNIFPLPMAGLVYKSDRIPGVTPQQAGLTISRLVQKGKKIDFYGRFGLFRHFEKPFQEDFFSYNAYVTALFKVFSPWTDEIAFRWGGSFGVSYADSIPGEEYYKFDLKGFPSSRLLNYLEVQIDFPLKRLIKSERVDGCYLGAVITHRSGIFGTADVFSNVAGGSDWFGLSLECEI